MKNEQRLMESISLEIPAIEEYQEGKVRGGFSTIISTTKFGKKNNEDCNCDCFCDYNSDCKCPQKTTKKPLSNNSSE